MGSENILSSSVKNLNYETLKSNYQPVEYVQYLLIMIGLENTTRSRRHATRALHYTLHCTTTLGIKNLGYRKHRRMLVTMK